MAMNRQQRIDAAVRDQIDKDKMVNIYMQVLSVPRACNETASDILGEMFPNLTCRIRAEYRRITAEQDRSAAQPQVWEAVQAGQPDSVER